MLGGVYDSYQSISINGIVAILVSRYKFSFNLLLYNTSATRATDEGIIQFREPLFDASSIFSIVAFSLFTSAAVNYSLFDEAIISDMTVMPSIVDCAALAA